MVRTAASAHWRRFDSPLIGEGSQLRLKAGRLRQPTTRERQAMLKSQPIVAFVATTDPKRAKSFYARTLGLRLVSEDGFALAFDAGDTMLRVAIVHTLQPAGYTVLGWI